MRVATMSAERPLFKWTPEVNASTIVTWALMILGLVASYVNTQRDVSDARTRIDRLETKTELLKEDFSEMRGDIRVIRQILESGKIAQLPSVEIQP